MKIGMSEATARKTLAILPANTADQDLQQLRTRIRQQLKATTAGGHLIADELAALIAAARYVLTVKTGGPVDRRHVHLTTAIPKLEALLARQEERE